MAQIRRALCLQGVYSPIQRLVDEHGWQDWFAPRAHGVKLKRSVSCHQHSDRRRASYLDTDDSRDDDSLATRIGTGTLLDTPSHLSGSGTAATPASGGRSGRMSADAVMACTPCAERIAESAGAAGDAYRFRYDNVSPEEGYSPIAGVRPLPRSRSAETGDDRLAWRTHVDGDGAVCSQPMYVALTLKVRVAQGADVTVQVCCCLRCVVMQCLLVLRLTQRGRDRQ